MEKLVIVGNGIAGHSALQEILKSGKEFDITVIWNEHPNTYLRTQILTYAVGEISEQKFFMTKGDFYAEKGVRSLKGTVWAIDKAARHVTLTSGEKLPYDKLILATGAYNFVPPVASVGHPICQRIDEDDLHCRDGIYTIRSLEDAKSFGEVVASAKKALVVGGGLLGLEAADTLLKQGLDVTVVEFASRLLPRQLDTASSLLFQKQAERSGLKFILGDSVDRIYYQDNVIKNVHLVSGATLETDVVLFSIGIRPNLEGFGEAVKTNRGILIDGHAQTSEPGIYACGDTAEYKGQIYGTWAFAMSSGKAAGQNAAGIDAPMKPYIMNTMFDSLGTRIFSTGSVDFDDPKLRSYVSGHPGSSYVKLLFDGEELAAGVLIGDTSQGPKLNKAIESRMPFPDAVASFGREIA